MDPVRLILNVIWFVFGGLWCGLLWILAGVIAAITIVGIPWARACFRIAGYTLWPFGRELVPVALLEGESAPMALFRFVGNAIWFVLPGWILLLSHLISAFCCFITIIGIPFGWAHLKLAQASVFPFGQRVVSHDLARGLHLRDRRYGY